MLRAIETYVEREEKREAWRQEGVAAWEEYRRTGLHLTNAEVTAWLSQLAAGNNVEPPECHI
jgi:predicted transcriptional regulator